MKQINTNLIPAAALAQIEAKAATKVAPIDNTKLVEDFRAEGGQLLHVRPRRLTSGETRGLSVAFKVKGRRIELASAVTHSADAFTKKIGTKTAIEHFKEGRTITLPMRSDHPTRTLQRALQILC